MTHDDPAIVHFLGTSGWFDSDTGNTICIAVDTPSFGIVLDAGNGLAKLDRTCELGKPWFILLSHLHLDHVIGLHTLVKMPFADQVTVIAPDGQLDHLERLMAAPFTTPPDRHPFALRLTTIREVLNDVPFVMQALPLAHSVPTVGFRLVVGSRTLAYIADTGPCENAVRLANRANLVLTECAYRPGEHHQGWPHLNPEAGAAIARDARAKLLVLVHFDASRYETIADRRQARRAAAEIFPETRFAVDGMRIEL